jgi:hypothetical protein
VETTTVKAIENATQCCAAIASGATFGQLAPRRSFITAMCKSVRQYPVFFKWGGDDMQ